MLKKTTLFTAAAAIAMVAAASSVKAEAPSSINIGTSAIGGTYYVYGGGMATVIQDVLGTPTSVEVTAGPSQNVAMVQMGQLDIGLVTTGPIYDAWTGEAEWTGGEEARDFRLLFPMFMTPFHGVALASSGNCSMTDLDGRRVGIGPAASTPGTYLPIFLPELGVNATLQPGGTADQATQLLDGVLDVMLTAAGVPVPGVQQVAAQQESCIFGFSEDEVATLVESYPFLAREVIPGGTYEQMPDDIETVGMWNFAIAHKDLDDDFVYELVKAIMENNETMVQTHQSASESLAENVNRNTFAYLHPGAVRYFQEIGIELEDAVIPPAAE